MKSISLLSGYLFLLSGIITGIAANGYLKTTEGFTKVEASIRLHQPHQSVQKSIKIFLGFSSDLPKFFNNVDNKITAKKYIEKFNMDKFHQQKDKALTEISKDEIEWSSIFEMSKVILISMINEKYGLENE